MSDQKKCENLACSCLAPSGENFCSAHCEGLKGSVEVICQCDHPSCETDVNTAGIKATGESGTFA